MPNRLLHRFLFLLLLACPLLAPASPEADDDTSVYVQYLERLQKLAAEGNPVSQGTLANLYFLGEAVPQDYAKAAQWHRKAAQQGYPESQFQFGLMYADGKGVQQDPQAAVEWLTKAASNGHPGAQYNLAVIYDTGKLVEKNPAEAAAWYRKAAEQGDPLAQYNLGSLYFSGEGLAKDLVEAYVWVSLAQAAAGETQPRIKFALEHIKSEMSEEQLAQAEAKLAERQQAKKPDIPPPPHALGSADRSKAK